MCRMLTAADRVEISTGVDGRLVGPGDRGSHRPVGVGALAGGPTEIAQDLRVSAGERGLRCAAVVVHVSDGARPLLREAVDSGQPVWCDIHDYDGTSPRHEDLVRSGRYLLMNDDAVSGPE